MVSPYSLVQDRIAFGVPGVHVRACVDQDPYDARMIPPYGFEQKRVAVTQLLLI